MINIPAVCDGHQKISVELRDMLRDKLKQYGTNRYEAHNRDFNLWMAYCDVYRKFLRLEDLTRAASTGTESAVPKLIDDYKDLANYAIMAIQILEEQK
jgi:hypothetical protein